MSKLPWWAQLVVFAVLVVAGVGAYYYFLECRRRRAWSPARPSSTTIQAGSTRAWRRRASCRSSAREVGDLEARLESLRPILPEEKDVADLLRRIQTMASQSNLTIRGFRPQAITTRELHAEWPISLELEGTYHNLGLFLDRVSKFPRIINVGGLAIAGQDRRHRPVTTIAVTCTATTFVLLDPDGAGRSPAEEGCEEGAEKDRMKLLLLPQFSRSPARLRRRARADAGRGAGACVNGRRAGRRTFRRRRPTTPTRRTAGAIRSSAWSAAASRSR